MPVKFPVQFANGTTLSGEDLDRNFREAERILSGGITTENFNVSTAIPNARLKNDDYEFVCHLRATSNQWAAAVATDKLDFCGIPGIGGTYEAYRILWSARDAGAQTGQFRVLWGEYDATGTWVTAATFATQTLVAESGANNTATTGDVAIAGTDLTQHASRQRYLTLECVTADATAVSSAEDSLAVSVLVRRLSGLTT